MSFFQAIIKILGSVWGVWSIAAFGLGIFLWVASLAIKKARLSRLTEASTYRFLRLSMILAFLLALAGLVMATVKEAPGKLPPNRARINYLTLVLKGEDATERRHAAEELVLYGDEAARELVRAIHEEAERLSSEILERATSGDFTDVWMGLLGKSPWRTPFFDVASACLVRIGGPAVPHVVRQLALESEGMEFQIRDVSKRGWNESPNLLEFLGQWQALLGAAGMGVKSGIVREVLSDTLKEIGPVALPALLDGLESPRLLLRATAFEVLLGMPEAANPTIRRLEELRARSQSEAERQQYLAAIRLLESRRP
ncbi:MAG: hypothetical protein SF066_13115 [Thermoanaerobaculia bacterium]|nr:hypothetical protein [Thermoanaerobaculia bacterium]